MVLKSTGSVGGRGQWAGGSSKQSATGLDGNGKEDPLSTDQLFTHCENASTLMLYLRSQWNKVARMTRGILHTF